MRKIGTILTIVLLITPIFANAFDMSQDGYLDACRDLPPGWSQETIYQPRPFSPISLCENTDSDVLILNREGHEIVELDLDESVSTYLSTGPVLFNAIAYQPNVGRIIALAESAFYASDVDSFAVVQEHPPDIAFSTLIVDPTDDSIYTANWSNGSTIYHFDSEGVLIAPVRTGIQGCTQLALDPTNNLLYFTETFPGRITRLNLTSNSTTVLTTGIAIPGTGEGIGIAVSPLGDLYYYVAEGVNRGFWRYNGTSFENIMGSKLGIGPITWSQKFDAVLCAAGFGACIVKYDPDELEPERLTPTVNTGSIIETSDGLLLLGIEKSLYQVELGVFDEFISNLPFSCSNLVLDSDENIYASLSNDSILILNVHRNGTYSKWFAGHIDGFPESLSFDSKNNMMVLLTTNGDPMHFDLWRIPVDNPLDYSKVLTITNVTNGACTVDKLGNIYIIERLSNIIYKIPDGSNEAQVLYTNVVEHAYLVGVRIVYSTGADGLILPRNDDLQVWPVDGSGSYLLAMNNVGIDNDGVFENANSELICTHSGQIFRLSYDDLTASITTATSMTSSTMTSTPSESLPTFPLEILIVVAGVSVVIVVIILFLRMKK